MLKLGLKSVIEGFQYKMQKIHKRQIRETKHNTTYTCQVVKLSEKHICSNIQLRPHHRQANKKVLSHLLKGISADSIAWSARMYALNLLRETPKESFQILHLYCYNLEKKNSRTVIHIKTS
uniref:Uncharacterized protein n=1 Tax=Lactuca sativa TaxID=4236 RepID=A0A9R1UIW8_LACSA|nr:hypothetical protein LSAT_V11C900477150 [Lactuca sativa]